MRKNITVNAKLAALLKSVADMRGMSQSDIIREAIREYMEKRGYV